MQDGHVDDQTVLLVLGSSVSTVPRITEMPAGPTSYIASLSVQVVAPKETKCYINYHTPT